MAEAQDSDYAAELRHDLESLEEKLAVAGYRRDRAIEELGRIDARRRDIALDALDGDTDALDEYALLMEERGRHENTLEMAKLALEYGENTAASYREGLRQGRVKERFGAEIRAREEGS